MFTASMQNEEDAGEYRCFMARPGRGGVTSTRDADEAEPMGQALCGMSTWRDGCGESRTSGSEGGPEKPIARKTTGRSGPTPTPTSPIAQVRKERAWSVPSQCAPRTWVGADTSGSGGSCCGAGCRSAHPWCHTRGRGAGHGRSQGPPHGFFLGGPLRRPVTLPSPFLRYSSTETSISSPSSIWKRSISLTGAISSKCLQWIGLPGRRTRTSWVSPRTEAVALW